MIESDALIESLISDHPPGEPDLFPDASGREAGEITWTQLSGLRVLQISREFWTAGQRQASSLHEISYRACFKPQLPAYFIRRFSQPGDFVYDPFGGRGTTAVEAALLGRQVITNDVSPLSEILAGPRLHVPRLEEVEDRLASIELDAKCRADIDLSMFYDSITESEIVSLRNYLKNRREQRTEDFVDRWIRMVATNRLTGHSPGFFSVYTFPPNQAVSQASQIRINERRKQRPEYRDTKEIIVRKTRSLVKGVSTQDRDSLAKARRSALFLNCDARLTEEIRSQTIQLTVTSPPFLDIVQYSDDNWLRCWFNDIDSASVAESITMAKTVEQWTRVMGRVFEELFRVTKRGGYVAFEVGELRGGKIKLDEHVVPLAVHAGFSCEAILINRQEFTKTSNIWGVKNNERGTNTNRIVLLSSP